MARSRSLQNLTLRLCSYQLADFLFTVIILKSQIFTSLKPILNITFLSATDYIYDEFAKNTIKQVHTYPLPTTLRKGIMQFNFVQFHLHNKH